MKKHIAKKLGVIRVMKELYTKQDLINALNDYVEVLRNDMRTSQNELATTILGNVKFSIEEIIEVFRG